MDRIISKISEIEEASAGIIEEGNVAKKQIADQIQKDTEAFDTALARETEERIERQKQQLQAAMDEKLERLRKEARQAVEDLEKQCREHGEQYLQEMFCHVTGE